MKTLLQEHEDEQLEAKLHHGANNWQQANDDYYRERERCEVRKLWCLIVALVSLAVIFGGIGIFVAISR